MRFTVENEALVKVVAFAQGSIAATESMPILEHVVMTVEGERLTIRTCDLSREAEAVVPASIQVPGSIAVPGAVLAALTKKLLRKGSSNFELGNNRLAMQSGSSRYELRTIDPKKLPTLKPRADADEGIATFPVHAFTLRAMLKDTSIAALKGHPSFFSQGVHLTREGNQLITVATDHHRLVHMKTQLPSSAAQMPPVTIKLDSVAEMVRLLGLVEDGDVQLTVRSSMVEMRVGPHTMRCMLLACEYPNYPRVIPKDEGQPRIVFRPYALAEAVNRAVLVYSREKKEAAVPFVQMLAADNQLYVVAGALGHETAEEIIECETNGIEATWGVNATYLLQMLATIPEDAQVRLLYTDQGTPLRFDNDKRPEILHMIMQAKQIRRGMKKTQQAENVPA